jgi:hypothetical protein
LSTQTTRSADDHANRGTRVPSRATQARSRVRARDDAATAECRGVVALQRCGPQEPPSEARKEAHAKRARAAREGWVKRHARLAALASAAGNAEQVVAVPSAPARKRKRMAASTNEDAAADLLALSIEHQVTDASAAAHYVATTPRAAGIRAEVWSDTRVDGAGDIGSKRARRSRKQAATPMPHHAFASAHEEAQRETSARAMRPPRMRAGNGHRTLAVARAGADHDGEVEDKQEVTVIPRQDHDPGRTFTGCK